MNRFITATAIVLAAIGITGIGRAAEPISQPDIIVFLVDELGPNRIGPLARTVNVTTPNIDALASAGVVYTSGYGAPVCVQARNMLMQGKWQYRRSSGAMNGNLPFPPTTITTVAERLRPLGYATYAIGKWHLGWTAGQQPLGQGFDHFLGWTGAPNSPLYYGHDPAEPMFRDHTPVQNTGYVTDTIGNEAVKILREPRTKPRFLYVAWTAMHYPLQESLAAVLKQLDTNIGKIVAAANPNTLFLFAGDNGLGPTPPFVGLKYDIAEGGIRVKFQMTWKGHVLPAITDVPASLGDFSPTIVAAAGGVQTDTDFVNLLKPVSDNRTIFFDALYDDPGIGVRQGTWKYYRNYKGIPRALYNIRTDKSEAHNLAGDPAQAATVARLNVLLDQFKAKLAD